MNIIIGELLGLYDSEIVCCDSKLFITTLECGSKPTDRHARELFLYKPLINYKCSTEVNGTFTMTRNRPTPTRRSTVAGKFTYRFK